MFTAAVLALGAGTADAADVIVADDACCTFAPGPYSQGLGEIPIFDNPATADAPHNVTATDLGPDGAPLFYSASILAGNTSEVRGAQYLEGGTYDFICTIHGAGMSGQLVVDGSRGTAVPRPSVKLSFPKQKLKAIRKSGKIRLKATAPSAATDINLTLAKGKLVLGTAKPFDLAAGKSRTITFKLNGKGRKAIKKGKKVAVQARSTVTFGKPGKASRTLR